MAQALENRVLKDAFGRVASKMRLSITDRCNFRCVYCMPEDVAWMDRKELLTFEELERLTRVAVSLGVRRIRLTGGEPLARKGAPALVDRLLKVPGLEKISMTTNGVFLTPFATQLREAGLDSLNVSLDSLDRARFTELCRRDALDQVLEGLWSAHRAGFSEIKINCVVMGGINDVELVDFAKLSRESPFAVRFIEFMPLDGDGIWRRGSVVPLKQIYETIDAVYPLDPTPVSDPSDPARVWKFRDGIGSIGVIASVTQPFCMSCDRIRITSDGKFRTCLFSTQEVDLKTPMRQGASDTEIADLLVRAVAGKEKGHLINSAGFEKPKRTMHAIGG